MDPLLHEFEGLTGQGADETGPDVCLGWKGRAWVPLTAKTERKPGDLEIERTEFTRICGMKWQLHEL